jgi:small subunit ribosomal protein S20
MAHHKSAQKRIRQTQRRTATNRARISRVRTFLKKVEQAIASGDREIARNALRAAQPELMRGVSKGIIHRNTAQRKMSRLATRINGM